MSACLAVLLLSPLCAIALVLAALVVNRPFGEVTLQRITGAAMSLCVLASVGLLGLSVAARGHPMSADFGDLIRVGDYAFRLLFVVDALAVGWIFFSALILGVVARFSATYMYRESGAARFSVCFLIFAFGSFVLETSGNIDLLFVGWELVGLSSVLLVAFFWRRPMPVRRAMYVFIVYRICDMGLLAGVVMLHHYAHASDWQHAFGPGEWPLWTAHLESSQASLLGGLFLIAAIGKSAMFPVTMWLPRAMEGPTPSSALFYGAISVHTGVFLLLRMAPLLDESLLVRMCVLAVGAITAITASLTVRTQADAKNALAFATVGQVGIVFIEIALQLYVVALVHMLANVTLRTFQFLRAGSGLTDHLARRATLGEDAGHASVPRSSYLYMLAFHGFFVEALLHRVFLRPVARTARLLITLEDELERILFGERRPQ
ncbi:MAG: hypothetical protein IT381_05730 [Deltaproteobacteria bacterium]|nr:hypothetical protein [Deltaproteobacteria bacterium]